MVAINKESKRSRKPPWPGMKLPLSFTPALLFSQDSNRSPKVPVIAAMNAMSPNTIVVWPIGNHIKLKRLTTITLSMIPPAVPSTVFLGEIRDNGVFPINDPTR